jgi:3-hydroxyisobutyrate dehydrogenase
MNSSMSQASDHSLAYGSEIVDDEVMSVLPTTTPATTPATTGFIGLGNLGVHLASSLLRAGHSVTVNDLNRSLADGLIAQGAKWADSAADVAAASSVVFTCLPSPAVVNAVVAGPNGILSGLAAGGTWIDMSTTDRSETMRLAALAAAQGVRMLEAPVTGGVHKAAAGEITVLVGGDEALYEEHKELLAAVGSPVLYMGPLGSAAVIKVITNMLAFIHLVAAGEALMLAKRGGLDLAKSFEAILNSSGNSFVHETESQVILNGSYNINFTMDLACKDLGFATQFGREFGVPLDLAGMVEQTFIRARSQYGGDAWSSQVVKLLEDALGTDLRAPGFPEVLQ